MKRKIIGTMLSMALALGAVSLGASAASAGAQEKFTLTASVSISGDTYTFTANTSITNANVTLLWDGHTSTTAMTKQSDNKTWKYTKTGPNPGERSVTITASKSNYVTQTKILRFTVSATPRLDKYIAGTTPLSYNGSTKYVTPGTNWGNWQSSVFGSQCKGFATAVFYNLYGYIIGSYPANARHTISINTSKTSVVFSTMRPSAAALRDKFQSARPGDFIQMSKATSQHSMIVTGVSGTGVWVYDANSDGANTIKTQFRNWDYFLNYMGSASYGISVYRAK